MKKIGIIGAMDSETEVFCRDFCAVPSEVRGIMKGKSDELEVYICCSGIGKVNAAVATQKMIDFFGVDAIINSGVAGGIADGISKLDTVISENLYYHDFNPIDILDRNPPYTSCFKADKELINKAVSACESLNAELLKEGKVGFNTYVGTVVSGDCFVSSSDTVKRLRNDFNALCTEMEGAAIAHTAYASGVPFVIIRTISDFADENAEDSFESFETVAAKRAAYIVKGILNRL